MKESLIQILLNTLEPNASIIKDSQVKLKQLEENPKFPLLLIEIIAEEQNHQKQLDLIATITLSKYIKRQYRSQDPNLQSDIRYLLMKLLQTTSNTKIVNEVILIVSYIVTVEYPEGKVLEGILASFNALHLATIHKGSPHHKFIFLKMLYKCIKAVHRDKIKSPDQLQKFKEILENYVKECLITLMYQLAEDLSQLTNQLEIIQNGDQLNMETGLIEILHKVNEDFLFESQIYIFQIYAFYNLIVRCSPLEGFNLIELAKYCHQIYKTITNLMIKSGLISKIKTSRELENVTELISSVEKHLMEAIEYQLIKIDRLDVVFEHFVSIYFSDNNHLAFYGETLITYNQLTDLQYLKMVCETEIFSKMKLSEEKLLINCLNTFSSILVNFGFSSTLIYKDFDLSENSTPVKTKNSMEKIFMPKLEIILKNLLDQALLIDIADLYKLRTQPEEYYVSMSQAIDEEIQLREAAQSFLKNISEYLDEQIIVNLCQTIQNELLNFPAQPNFRSILKRESHYYILAKLYNLVKNDINFSELLQQCLAFDFSIQDNNFDTVKIQLLQLTFLHIHKSYTFEENFNKALIAVYNLIPAQNASNMCLVLMALKITAHLIKVNTHLASIVPDVAPQVLNLCNHVSYMESKLVLFEFFENSIVGNFPGYYSVIWDICEQSYNAFKDRSGESLNLKIKIISVLVKLIEVTNIEYNKANFLLDILTEGIQEEESSEEILVESSYHLFGKMLTKLDLTQLSNEQIQRLSPIIQVIRSIMCKSLEYMPLSVLILENLIISGIPAILETVGKVLLETVIVWLVDVKETAIKYYFDMVELYLIVAKDHRTEFSSYLLEKILNSLKNDNQMNITYLANILRFLARLAFENVEALYYVLNTVSSKLGIADCKYTLLSKFYDFVKEETIYSNYYFKKSFCIYTFALLALFLKELEANDGINFNKMALNQGNKFETDFKAVLPVFCKCLSELHDYDANQLEHIEPEIYLNLAVLFEEDDLLKGNSFLVDSFKNLTKVLLNDPMRKFNVCLAVKELITTSPLILNDTETKAIFQRELTF